MGGDVAVRGVRGATVIPSDVALAPGAVRDLLKAMVEANGIAVEDLAVVLFSFPPELAELRAAQAAREMGWDRVPLFELDQPARADDLPRCLRVLFLWNTRRSQGEIVHVYRGEAARLRPDLAGRPAGEEETLS
ncbi:MAG: chorismate mutase [Bacillota bacterium]|nr:chorismate mutase [Bacillota bacterium]